MDGVTFAAPAVLEAVSANSVFFSSMPLANSSKGRNAKDMSLASFLTHFLRKTLEAVRATTQELEMRLKIVDNRPLTLCALLICVVWMAG
jgi:hypothetical protein